MLFSMPVGIALVVSEDVATVQQLSHALHQLSIATDLCREIPTAIPLLNRRKFDAVIVDLHLGEDIEKVLDAARTSHSNRTAVTFAVTGSAAETAETAESLAEGSRAPPVRAVRGPPPTPEVPGERRRNRRIGD